MGILERMGFVRLRDFGLLMTPDRRIVSTRPVLDDGFGATIVGWEGNDLAAMELAAKPPAAAAVVAMARPKPVPPPLPPPPAVLPLATPPAPTPVVRTAPAVVHIPPPVAVRVPTPVPVASPFAATPIAAAPAVAPPFAPTPVATPIVSPSVSDEPPEDEWEWEIAVARARAVETPRAAKKQPPAPKTNTSQWLTSKPLTTTRWQEDTAIRSVTQFARKSEQLLAQAAPRTIIPVPTLPSADARRIVDDIATRQMTMPRRIARGTSPANDDTSTAVDLRAVPSRR